MAIAYKQQQGALRVHAREQEALTVLLREWNRARTEHCLTGSVMIARGNTTRTTLNEHARRALKHDGILSGTAVFIGNREFCLGERVIARRNDRYRDIDNGTCATVTALTRRPGP